MTNNILFDSTLTQYLKFIDNSANQPKIANLLLSYGIGGEAIASDVSVKINKYIAIAAIPDEGYLFDKWIVDGIEYLTNPLSLLMNEDKIVVASFIQNI